MCNATTNTKALDKVSLSHKTMQFILQIKMQINNIETKRKSGNNVSTCPLGILCNVKTIENRIENIAASAWNRAQKATKQTAQRHKDIKIPEIKTN